jgi:NAD(P)-dependent dehydrogenase (short-subunit alcohol dehydrogenase family)
MSTTLEGKAILVTGANRGIGQALLTEALRRGAARVYAGTRQPYAHPDPRVTVLPLDITNQDQVRAAAAQVESLDILVNNAGTFEFDDLGDRDALERHLSVNLFGTYRVTQAFLPALVHSGGAIVNNVSIASLAPIPVTPAYSLSKAAAFSLTQSLRMLLASQGVRVHAVLTGPVDTDRSAASTYPRPLLSPSRRASSTRSKSAKRTSSPIPCRRPSPTAGARGRPRRWSARTPRSCNLSPSRPSPSPQREAREVRKTSGQAVAGIAAAAACRPHGTVAAGAVTIPAGAYELTPLKRYFRRRCRQTAGSGFGFGLCCLGASAGLMAMVVVLGAMSAGWMAVIAVLVTAQKLLPPGRPRRAARARDRRARAS